MDQNNVQQRMQEIQKNGDFLSAYSKIVSGKAGYTAVVEKRNVIIYCKGCNKQLEDTMKFCSECGTKVEVPEKK